jgi:cytoskeletal protein CcmA (bactofilin family)
MKGDFTRFTFNPKKHYSGVLMQQGRVQLDADWNEQAAIDAYRREVLARDTVGFDGAPVADPGFELSAHPALAFDGENDYVFVEGRRRAFSFHGREPFTIEAWVRPREVGESSTIFGKFNPRFESAWLRGGYFCAVDAEGTVSFHRVEIERDEEEDLPVEEELAVEPGDGSEEDEATGEEEDDEIVEVEEEDEVEETEARRLTLRHVHTIERLPWDRFSHVAVTFDGHESRIYIGGRLAAQQRHEGRGARTSSPVLIGARLLDDEPAWFFAGQLSDVRVWRVARTQEEIERHMRRRLSGRERGLVACWPCDRIRDERIHDITGHRHAGWLGRGHAQQMPTLVAGELRIGRGRYYVAGRLCENDAEVAYTAQPDYPGALLPPRSDTTAIYLAYLDVWARFISEIEDPSVREVALGGPDTAGRSQTLAQVKLLPAVIPAAATDADAHRDVWRAFVARAAERPQLRVRRQASATYLGNQLYRVEIHTPGGLYGLPRAPDAGSTALRSARTGAGGTVQVVPVEQTVDGVLLAAGQYVEVFHARADGTQAHGGVASISVVDAETRTYTLASVSAPTARFWVELTEHGGFRLRPLATFKWSRENGSVRFPVTSFDMSRSVVSVEDLSADEYALKKGDWVELVNDTYVLQGRTTPLAQVQDIDRNLGTVTLTVSAPEDFDSSPAEHPLLRRWDQQEQYDELTAGGVILARTDAHGHIWLNLEAGIQVAFSGTGLLRAGDYWVAPARTLTGDVEWPATEAGPLPQPPHGIEHNYALLASLFFDGDSVVVAHDLRQLFAPLVAQTGGGGNGHHHDHHRFVRRTGDTMTGPLHVESSLRVSDTAHVGDNLHVGDELHVGDNLHVDGDARVGGELHVGDDLRVGDDLHVSDDLRVGGDARVEGELHAGRLSLRELTLERLDARETHAHRSVATELRGDRLSTEEARAERLHTEHLHAEHARTHHLEAHEARIEVLHATLAPDTVGTRQLIDRSVTRAKLADDVGDLWSFPAGYSILGETEVPPVGFVYTGRSFIAVDERARWRTRSALPVESPGAVYATAHGGRIYAITQTRQLWKYDPRTDDWRERPALPSQGQPIGLVAIKDKLYAFCDSGGMWAYEPGHTDGNHAWRQMSNLGRARTGCGVAAVGGKVYVFGGRRKVLDLFTVDTRRHDCFDPATDTWTKRKHLPAPRYDCGVGVLNGKVCAFGGERSDPFGFSRRLDTGIWYNPASDAWADDWVQLPAALSSAGVGVVDGKLYLVGGRGDDGWTATTVALDALTGWSEMPAICKLIDAPQVVALDGRLYVLGSNAACEGECCLLEWPVGVVFYIHRRRTLAEETSGAD